MVECRNFQLKFISFITQNFLLPLMFISLCGCTLASRNDKSVNLPAHHAEDGFQNPYVQKEKRGFLSYFKMRYFSDVSYHDYEQTANLIPTVKVNLDRVVDPGELPQITWVGHATVLIQYRGISILTDPMFSDRASPVSFLGPKRVNAPAFKIKELPPIDYVIISHNHYDHLDRKSVEEIGSSTFWLVPLGLKSWFLGIGIQEQKVIEFDWWDVQYFDKVTITATPAQHWSARNLWDRRKTLWSSWMVQIDDFTVWYSGDTGYNSFQFKAIGAEFGNIDLALISIGAYEPRWFMKDVHINPEEAVQIHEDINSKHSIAVQWGTFRMTAESIDDPPAKLKAALAKKNIPEDRFEIMKIGEIKVLDTISTK